MTSSQDDLENDLDDDEEEEDDPLALLTFRGQGHEMTSRCQDLQVDNPRFPTLNSLVVNGTGKFKENKTIENFSSGRLALQADKLDFSLHMSGSDVFNGLNEMIATSRRDTYLRTSCPGG